MLSDMQNRKIDWETYAGLYLDLLRRRSVETVLPRDLFSAPAVLLCSEHTAERCHRRLALEYLQQAWGGLSIIHL